MKAGIISLSTDFEESYSEELEKNNIRVIMLAPDDYEHQLSGLDAVIIREDATEDTARTCSILLKLKEKSDAYVWVLSSSPQNIIRTVYLQLGALGIISDDCKEDELQLIISNSLSRKADCRLSYNYSNRSNENDEDINDEADGTEKLKLIPRNYSVKIKGRKEIPLTKLEYRTMDFLYRNQNNTVTYKELFEGVWGQEFKKQNYRVANLIFHLREKIEGSSMNPVLIRTVRSKGYMLDLDNYQEVQK